MMLGIVVLLLLVNQAQFKRNLQNPCDEPTTINGTDLAEILLSSYVEYNDVTIPVPEWVDQQFIYVNCSSRGVERVPNEIAESAEIIDLTHNFIRQISNKDFSKFKNLTIILLGYNCYTGIFDVPLNLPVCNDRTNKQLQIDSDVFLFSPELKWIDLNSNYLNALPRLPDSLRILDISATQLGNITNELIDSDIPNLTIFLGGFNCLAYPKHSPCFHNFTISSLFASSLQLLNMAANNLNKVPAHLFTNNLTKLFLSYNILTLHKDDFINFPMLELLDLGHIVIPYAGESCTKGKEILEIPEGIFDPLRQLQILILENDNIQYIPKDLFKYNKNLQYLDLSLSSLGLQVFDPIFVQDLFNLKYLDLSSSRVCLKEVDVDIFNLSGVFSSLTSLESLLLGFSPETFEVTINMRIFQSIAANKILKTSFKALSGCTQLRMISVAGMSISIIEEDAWSELHGLQNLFAAFNNLHTEEKLFHHKDYQKNISKAYIFQPSLHYKPRQVFYSNYLLFKSDKEPVKITLDYSFNKITNLSISKILFLNNITHLDVSHNKIMHLNQFDFANLNNLVEINLEYNSLRTIPPFTLQKLGNLQSLLLISPNIVLMDVFFLANLNPSSEVKLRLSVPSDIVVFDALQYYAKLGGPPFYQIIEADLSGNEILTPIYTGEIPVFGIFPNAAVFILDNCGIESLPLNFFIGLESLKKLSLEKNRLKSIPIYALWTLPALEELSLYDNFITSVDAENKTNFFDHFKHLTYLSLASNSITQISPGFFNKARLQYLDLSYNRIYSLNSSVLSPSMLAHLKFLDLRGNNLDCSCNAWLPFFVWYLSDSSLSTILPGFLPKCTSDIEKYLGGCVSCQYPKALRGLSLSTFGDNSSCVLNVLLAYSIAFSSFILLFTVVGSISYSKWLKRLVFQKVNEQFRVQSLDPTDTDGYATTFSRGKKVFLFFDTENNEVADWIDGTLVPRLTNIHPSIYLTIVGRDNPCGLTPTQHILQQITESKKVVVFLTENFCYAPGCKFIINALQELRYSFGNDLLILVTWYGRNPPRVPILIQQTLNRKCSHFLRFDYMNDDEIAFIESLRTIVIDKGNTDSNEHLAEE